MAPEDQGNPTPQFETVEYNPAPVVDPCAACGQSVVGNYFRINGTKVCASCADKMQRGPRDSHSAYSKALLFGIGAAIIGLICYAGFAIITGWMIGYVSLGVGYLVGKAMMKGSGGVGGRRYQITAALLTYAAVSMSAIPTWISAYKHSQPQKQPTRIEQSATSGDSSAAQTAQEEPSAAAHPSPEAKKVNVLSAVGYLALIGLASPFLELQSPLHGLIGLFILLIGVQIAWKTAAGRPHLEIDGPF
jgi:hypothetical protein